MGLLVLFLIIGFQTQAFSALQYRVKKGDTLGKIATKYGVTVESLKQVNGLTGNALALKQVLRIPATKHKSEKKQRIASSVGKKKAGTYYTVRKGDTLAKISRKTGVSVAELKRLNHFRGTTLKVGRKLLVARHGLPAAETAQPDPAGTVVNDDIKPLEEDLAPISDQEWAEIGRDQGEGGTFLGKWRSAKERQLLVKVALGFLGAPYRSGGDSVRGVDSSGFVQKIYEIFDVALPRTALEQSRLGKRIDRAHLEEGDLVFFQGQKSTGVVGIYIGNDRFVYAAADGNREVRIGNVDEPQANIHFIKAVRLKDLTGGA
jgi:LysM repeat protein